MDETASALEHLVLQKLAIAPEQAQTFRNELRPVVRDLVSEALPALLEQALPSLLAKIDDSLSNSILKALGSLRAKTTLADETADQAAGHEIVPP